MSDTNSSDISVDIKDSRDNSTLISGKSELGFKFAFADAIKCYLEQTWDSYPVNFFYTDKKVYSDQPTIHIQNLHPSSVDHLPSRPTNKKLHPNKNDETLRAEIIRELMDEDGRVPCLEQIEYTSEARNKDGVFEAMDKGRFDMPCFDEYIEEDGELDTLMAHEGFEYVAGLYSEMVSSQSEVTNQAKYMDSGEIDAPFCRVEVPDYGDPKWQHYFTWVPSSTGETSSDSSSDPFIGRKTDCAWNVSNFICQNINALKFEYALLTDHTIENCAKVIWNSFSNKNKFLFWSIYCDMFLKFERTTVKKNVESYPRNIINPGAAEFFIGRMLHDPIHQADKCCYARGFTHGTKMKGLGPQEMLMSVLRNVLDRDAFSRLEKYLGDSIDDPYAMLAFMLALEDDVKKWDLMQFPVDFLSLSYMYTNFYEFNLDHMSFNQFVHLYYEILHNIMTTDKKINIGENIYSAVRLWPSGFFDTANGGSRIHVIKIKAYRIKQFLIIDKIMTHVRFDRERLSKIFTDVPILGRISLYDYLEHAYDGYLAYGADFHHADDFLNICYRFSAVLSQIVDKNVFYYSKFGLSLKEQPSTTPDVSLLSVAKLVRDEIFLHLPNSIRSEYNLESMLVTKMELDFVDPSIEIQPYLSRINRHRSLLTKFNSDGTFIIQGAQFLKNYFSIGTFGDSSFIVPIRAKYESFPMVAMPTSNDLTVSMWRIIVRQAAYFAWRWPDDYEKLKKIDAKLSDRSTEIRLHDKLFKKMQYKLGDIEFGDLIKQFPSRTSILSFYVVPPTKTIANRRKRFHGLTIYEMYPDSGRHKALTFKY